MPRLKTVLMIPDPIVGFSYSFSKSIISFLKERMESNIFFKDENRRQNDRSAPKPEIATAIEHLSDQLHVQSPCCTGFISPNEFDHFIDHAEKFLAIFEKDQPEKSDQDVLLKQIKEMVGMVFLLEPRRIARDIRKLLEENGY